MEYFDLNNGTRMPMAGIGVFMLSPAEAEASVESALRSGVRLIDTANAYMNESATGRGIKKSGVAREEIFLVSKLWPTVYAKETAVDEMLARLGTDYVDLLFLHQPTANWREGYKNIEKAYREGKVKAIGLSNFPEDLLEEAIEWAEIKPHVVQVEAHPYFPQHKLKKIRFLAGYEGHPDSEARLNSFRSAMKEHGLSVDEQKDIHHGNMWYNCGPAAYEAFFADPEDRPEAVVCANDYMAAGLVKEVLKHGLRVPEDVIITGFDNVPNLNLEELKLTTVEQDFTGMARAAVQELDRQIRTGDNRLSR